MYNNYSRFTRYKRPLEILSNFEIIYIYSFPLIQNECFYVVFPLSNENKFETNINLALILIVSSTLFKVYYIIQSNKKY